MPKNDKNQKGKSQAIAPVGLKVKLVDAHARAKDGNRAGRKQPAGGKQVHQPVRGDKAPKKNDEIEPLLVETKKVRPLKIPSDLLRSIEDKSRRKRLRSPPPPQAHKPGQKPGHKPDQAGQKTGAEKKAPRARIEIESESDDEFLGTQYSQTSAGFFLRDGDKSHHFSSQPPSNEGAGQVDNLDDDKVDEGDESEDIDLDKSDDDNALKRSESATSSELRGS